MLNYTSNITQLCEECFFALYRPKISLQII